MSIHSRTWWLCAFAAAVVLAIGWSAIPPAPMLITGEATAPGKMITPTAARGAIFQDLKPGLAGAPQLHANHAAAVTVSPDGRQLAILTTGHNVHYDASGALKPELSTEYVFLFDIAGASPKQTQVLQIANTFHGIAWGAGSDRLYVSGGKDDLVAEYVRGSGSTSRFAKARTFALGHTTINGGKSWVPMPIGPTAGQLAMSPDGTRLLVSNMMNDSVSLIDLTSGRIVCEQDLRPGKIDPSRVGQPGGSYPGSLAWVANDHAYVASERDREIISLVVKPDAIQVDARIAVDGQPVALLANRHGTRLFAALDNVDRVAVVDVGRNAIIEQIAVLAPESVYINTQKLGGANPNALALTPDEHTLLVSNGAQNAVAVVSLGDDGHASTVAGLIPTGWYPTGIATRHDGSALFIVNGKSPIGPNASWCHESTCLGEIPPKTEKGWVFASNGHAFQVTKDATPIQMQRAGFLTIPTPSPAELARLTKQVAHNNGFDRPDKTAADEQLFAFLRQHITHVIYIVKENRSYDQILGDLERGNGDPRLTLFPEAITPNHHAIARNFVTLDNFLVSGEGSWTGWQWSTAARTSVFAERNDFAQLALRGGDTAGWGINRGLNVGLATSKARMAENPDAPSDPDVLPGARDVAALDGYIWDAALRHGLTVRNYGFYANSYDPHVVRDPRAEHKQMVFPNNPSLMPFTNIYYRPFDMRTPEFWRMKEWKREFDEFSRTGTMPNLMLMALSNDHLGQFEEAVDGVNTPPMQMADNDYALGFIAESVANSPYADSTLIVSIEDDTWDGVDHVDAFRSPVFFAGPYVRKQALVSTRYTTVNVVKTIGEILGIGPIGINDAMAAPMSDVFDTKAASASSWTFKAIIPGVLRSTQLPLPPPTSARAETGVPMSMPRHSPRYWARAMADQDFSHLDAGEFGAGNRGLWRGMKGDIPYPVLTSRARR